MTQSCWHCHVDLEPVEPPHCEKCPSFNDCHDEGCKNPGCSEDRLEQLRGVVREYLDADGAISSDDMRDELER